jgi:antitoxin component YwqK of YwqJK toxin-antitoxin module/ankyrin repeat protein
MLLERLGKGLLIAVFGFVLAACGGATHEVSVPQAKRLSALESENVFPFKVEGKPFTGTVVAHHADKVKAIEIEMKEGYPKGKISEWFANGQPYMAFEAHWDEKEESFLEKGIGREWREDGSLVIETHHDAQGRLQGDQLSYCEGGQKESSSPFRDGQANGLWEEWDCSTGNRVAAYRYNNGVLDGAIESWFQDGAVRLLARADSAVLEGPLELWHSNGQLAEQATLAAGVNRARHQPLEFLLEDLNRNMLRFTGTRKQWNAEGDVLLEAHYTEQGEPTGLWMERDASGRVTRQDHAREDYVDDQYAPALAQALNSGTPRNAEAVFYYLDKQLIQPNQKIATELNYGMFGTRGVSYSGQPGRWPRSNWASIVHGIPFELLPRFLDTGADVDARDSEGRTRLMRCAASIARRGCTAAEISYLLEHRADAHAVDLDGANALRLLGVEAINQRYQTPNPAIEHPKAFKALLETGVNVDARDANGNSLLIEALRTRNAALATQLIEAGADVKTPNKKGNAPIHFVFLKRDDSMSFDAGAFAQQMLPLLIGKGADINQTLKWDRGEPATLHQVALRGGAIELVQLLEKHGASH